MNVDDDNSEQWIEMNPFTSDSTHVPQPRNIPKLRLDTSNLADHDDHEGHNEGVLKDDSVPKSAILGLTSGMNDNKWLKSSPHRRSDSYQLSPNESLKRRSVSIGSSQSNSSQNALHLTRTRTGSRSRSKSPVRDTSPYTQAEVNDTSRFTATLSVERSFNSHSGSSSSSKGDTRESLQTDADVDDQRSPERHYSPGKRASAHLTLSGAAYSAQQDLLEAEESDQRLEDKINERRTSTNGIDDDEMSLISRQQSLTRKNVPMGRSLFYFNENNRLRVKCFQFIQSQWCKYIIIILTLAQIVLLCVEQRGAYELDNEAAVVVIPAYMNAYVALYSIYTLILAISCIAYGVFTNEVLTASDIRGYSIRMVRYLLSFVTLGAIKRPSSRARHEDPLKSHKCVLRSSWGRVEMISAIFFWVFYGITQNEYIKSLELFIAGISHLRVLRILDYIPYTRIVLNVIKTAIPFLLNVLIFIGFFVSIWTIIGVQSFNGSLRRVCVYGDVITSQHCGSWLKPGTLEKMPYMRLDSRNGTYQSQNTVKGYTCPVNSICVELREFPPGGSYTELANKSFDNIFNALEIVLIMTSNNGFTDIMYEIIDSEYLISSLFFISGVLILGIWLINLMVAVMVSSYAAVRRRIEASDDVRNATSLKQWISAKLSVKEKEYDSESVFEEPERPMKQYVAREKLYGTIYMIFTILALVDLIVQASLTPPTNNLLPWEACLATGFLIEIISRFILTLPHWRAFIFTPSNALDLVLAIANGIILAFYSNIELYSWLTAFQLLRVYRVVGVIKYSRVFWMQVFGNFSIFAGLTGFYFLTTLLCTLIAEKMLRGQFPLYDDSGEYNKFSFYDLSASFFSMYQVSSTENWTDVLFWATDNVSREGSNVVGLACMGILFFGWLFFANFLVLNLFIGVMSENLHGSIHNKREEQVKRFAEEISSLGLDKDGSLFGNTTSGLDVINSEENCDRVFRHVTVWDRIGGFFGKYLLRYSKGNSVLNPIRTAVEQNFVIEFLESNGGLENILTTGEITHNPTFLSLDDAGNQLTGFQYYKRYPIFKKLKYGVIKFLGFFHHYPEGYRKMVRYSFEKRHREAVADSSKAFVEAIFGSSEHKLNLLEEYCRKHPNFDKTLFLFSKDSKIRLFFQSIFTSSNGSRRSKVYPRKWVLFTVRAYFMGLTIAIVVLTCFNTPLETMKQKNKSHAWNSSSIYDVVFGSIFAAEFIGKVIADGFHFTPNAYTWSIWNNIDFIVLISIWMTFINDILHGPLSRYVRALMALRALRLLGFYTESIHVLGSALKYGMKNILGAVIIMMSIVIPYSVWGKNIFQNRLSSCNDGNIEFFANCTGEFTNSVFDNFDVLSPRSIQGNYFDYDNFWHALLIQFGVLSLEGWVDVLQAVSSISNSGEQSVTYSSKGNAAYPILYNYVGTVLIITMLVAVIIRNYAIITGTAFLTEQQLSWLDVKRTLNLIRPTPKPPTYRNGTLRAQLLSIMPTWIQSIEVWTLFTATLNLSAYFYPVGPNSETVYQLVQVACSTLLVCLSLIRLIVLKPTLFFHTWWNPFGLVVCLIVQILTIVILVEPAYKISGVDGVIRAAVISMLLLWIPRTKRLYQFYSISTTALAEISLLLRAWFTLYIAYAIALNQSFGLTKLGSQSTWTKNFRTIPKALIALFFMSCGEGWNQFLIDYTISKPYCIENSRESECGIPGFGYFLFISWNIISMYVFANLFISLICEACWYVYRSGPVNINEFDIVYLLESWQKFDPRGAGFIRTRDLYRFLGRSQGYFSMRVYETDSKYNVHRILSETNADIRSVIDPYDVDIDAINQYLKNIPTQKYRQSLRLYELFTTQARLMAEPIPGGSGIRFSKLVLLFPLYQDMDPAESLSLREFIELKAKLYEAQLIMAAEFIAKAWRRRQQRDYSFVSFNEYEVVDPVVYQSV